MKVTLPKNTEMYLFHLPVTFNILGKEYYFMCIKWFYILTEDYMILEYCYSVLTKAVTRIKTTGLWPFRDIPTKFMCT